MAWTAPKTWSAAEVPTAALFNTHIRDNMTLLKVPFNAAGLVTALSSDYVADLSGANLTGLIKTGANSDITTGKQTISNAIVLPVGADKYAGSLTEGSVWVEGDYLHHVGGSATGEWRFLGDFVSTPGGGALEGSIWVDTDGAIHYIDEDGDERKLTSSVAPHTDAAATSGSVWIETYMHSTYTSGAEKQWHNDVAHADDAAGSHTDSHGDSSSHTDWHSDTAHTDSHGDTAHSDTHGDSHGDHYDSAPPHLDYHGDYHDDVAHSDSHGDVTHVDSHGDSSSHTDTHTDHADHADTPHYDNPESVAP